MVGNAGTRERSHPWLSGVRQRATISIVAALLATVGWGWLPTLSFSGAPAASSASVKIGGTRFDMQCHGSRTATVVIYGRQSIAGVINEPVKAELARSVRVCTVTVYEGSVRFELPPLTDVLLTLMASSGEPAPCVVITHESQSPAFDPAPGKLSGWTVGYVLIHPSPYEPTGLVVAADGTNWPLPVDDIDKLVLAILKLFWPPDE